MFIIDRNITNEIIIKNSRFICKLYRASSLEEVNSYLNNIKYIYKDATHYCSAYIIDEVKRFNDDGEPGGTAGSPILQVLEKNELNYILCIVVRYFGGIKLGASGLVRAYTKSVTEVLKKVNFNKLIKGNEIIIKFPYEKFKEINYLVKNELIISKKYDKNIEYEIDIHKDTLDKLKLIKDIEIIIGEEVYIEKR